MATVKFRLVGRNNIKSIYVRILGGREVDVQVKTELLIDSKDWQTKNNLPKQTTSANKVLTTDLLGLKTHLFNKFNDANSLGAETSQDWLKHNIGVFFGRVSENKTETNVLYWLNHIIENSHKIKNAKKTKGLSYNRLKAYKGLIVNFAEFQKYKNIEIHARSVFLQGLLLDLNNLPPYFSTWRAQFKKYLKVVENSGFSLLEYALNFALNTDELDKILVGVNNTNQLIDIINSSNKDSNLKAFSINDVDLLNPSLWSY